MKKSLLILSVFIAGISTSYAQCVTDPAIDTTSTEAIILPDSAVVMVQTPAGTFDQTFTVFVPSALSMTVQGFPVTGTIDSMKLEGIAGSLASSLTLNCGTCWFPVDSAVCFTVTGTMPNVDDERYELQILVTPYGMLDSAIVAQAAAFGFPIEPELENNITNQSMATYTIEVGTPVGIEDFSANGSFNVSGNYPNPFDGSTTINFNTTVAGSVDFTVVDVLGRQVYDTNITASAGSNSFVFTTDLASGTYFFSMTDGTNTITRKIVVN